MLGYRTLLSSCRTVTKSICSPGWWPISIHAIIQLKIFFIVLRNQECSSRVRTCGCPAQNSQFLTASVTFCCSLTPIPDLWAGLAHQERLSPAGKLLVGEHVQTSCDPLAQGGHWDFWHRQFMGHCHCRLSVSSGMFPSCHPVPWFPVLYWDLMETHRKRSGKGPG